VPGLDLKPGHDQASYAVRCEWGPVGAAAVPADVAVVVDVLSFTTTVGVAVERGIDVLPFRWRDSRAREHAASRDALLAVGRLEAREQAGQVSLSPAAMAGVRDVERIVLPSPNGSTITWALAGTGARVVASRTTATTEPFAGPVRSPGRA
jgi:2-phosphosulfolactate phosphatase